MVTEPDHNAIIDRIIEIFKADSSLWNTDGSKIRSFTNGRVIAPLPYPYCFIYFESEDDKPFEAVTVGGAPAFMSQTSSYHKFIYNIVVVTNKKTSETGEQDINSWVKLIKQRLKSNVDLRKPSDGTDAKVKVTHPIRTRQKSGTAPNGEIVAGAVITFQLEAATV